MFLSLPPKTELKKAIFDILYSTFSFKNVVNTSKIKRKKKIKSMCHFNNNNKKKMFPSPPLELNKKIKSIDLMLLPP